MLQPTDSNSQLNNHHDRQQPRLSRHSIPDANDDAATNQKQPISESSSYIIKQDNNCQQATTVFLAKVIVQQTNQAKSDDEDQVESSDNNTEDTSGKYTNSEAAASNNDLVPSLLVDQNDVIEICEQQCGADEKCFLAKSDQQMGRILKSSCLILDDQIPSALCNYLIDNHYFNLYVCFASFVAQDVGDLSVTKGDIIVALVSVNEHWLQGQVCFDSQANRWPKLAVGRQIGTFPLNHCWLLDTKRVKEFCIYRKDQPKRHSQGNLKSSSSSAFTSPRPLGWAVPQPPANNSIEPKEPFLPIAHSSSLSSGTSSLYSTEYNQANHHQRNEVKQQNHYTQQDHQDPFADQPDNHLSVVPAKPPPPRPANLPHQISDRQKSSSERSVSRPASLLTLKQQDKLKGWLHTVKKKTARLSTRITASLGLISLTRDEEFERHYDSFKQLEKSIRVFIKNLTSFVEHFESFLLALQNTSDNLADFYRDKSYQKDINELRKKNKALNCEHFHAFKRTIDRQVITVASQLLQKFSGPHQLVNKRSAKLLDYDTKTKEMESCRDLEKKAALREDYVIAKDIYDRINGQLIEELPLFTQFALDIFRECILVLLEGRRNLLLAYTKQTANLLDTPLMASYTASDVASSILMSCELAPQLQPPPPPPPPPPPLPQSSAINSRISSGQKMGSSHSGSGSNHEYMGSVATSEHETQPSGSSNAGFDLRDQPARPHSALSNLSSEFDQMAIAAREIGSSTPLSQIDQEDQDNIINNTADEDGLDEGPITNGVRFDEPDAAHPFETLSDGSNDNRHNENIESTIEAAKSNFNNLNSTPAPRMNLEGSRKRRTRHQIYVASWPFVATGPNQLSIACNQPLKLIKGADECGNSDWSLVKNKSGHLGYVPTSYIKRKE